jgi:hypothetical protein
MAVLASPVGTRLAVASFESSAGVVLPTLLPGPSAIGAARGLYTLATWAAFVLACRSALADRSWRHFVLPAFLTVALALIRPWTVGDFTALWATRIAAGDVVACASAAAAAAITGLLGISVQRNQSRSKPNRATGTRRAETTSNK